MRSYFWVSLFMTIAIKCFSQMRIWLMMKVWPYCTLRWYLVATFKVQLFFSYFHLIKSELQFAVSICEIPVCELFIVKMRSVIYFGSGMLNHYRSLLMTAFRPIISPTEFNFLSEPVGSSITSFFTCIKQ